MGQGVSGGSLEDIYYLQKVKLGQGSFGSVWRAVDKRNGALVAVKQLDKASMPRRGVKREDVEREISVMRAVRDENVTRMLDSFEDRRSIYLALEYCDGGDFGDKVKERGLTLQEPEAADWIWQICSAIHALHSKGICHRDIKPDNFMVHSGVLKLADFGLAMHLPHSKLLTEKCGTPAFMSPEQHKLPRPSKGYGHPCDMWAAGVSMYMCMYGGRHPFLLNTSHLDDKRLHSGEMDFSANGGFFGFGIPDSRFSEAARSFCQKMVCPDPVDRITADQALKEPWLEKQVGNSQYQEKRQRAMAATQSSPESRPIERPTSELAVGGSSGSTARNMAAVGDEMQKSISDFFGWSKTGTPDENARLNVPSGHAAKVSSRPEPAQPSGTATTSDIKEQELVRRIQALEQQLHEERSNKPEVLQQLDGAKHQLLERQSFRVNGGANAYPAQTSGMLGLEAPQPSSLNFQSSSLNLMGSPTGLLTVGVKCRYHSLSWNDCIPALVQQFNPQDGTYNLDVRQHAKLENIRPSSAVTLTEAWPAGTFVSYESASMGDWIASVVISFNEPTSSTEGTYNLDVRECASVDRIRPRLPR